MSISFHDPRGDTRVAAEPYSCQHPLKDGAVIGLLANGFPDSIAFLDAVEQALTKAQPSIQVKRYRKPGASAPAEPELVARIAEQCDALITAYGH